METLDDVLTRCKTPQPERGFLASCVFLNSTHSSANFAIQRHELRCDNNKYVAVHWVIMEYASLNVLSTEIRPDRVHPLNNICLYCPQSTVYLDGSTYWCDYITEQISGPVWPEIYQWSISCIGVQCCLNICLLLLCTHGGMMRAKSRPNFNLQIVHDSSRRPRGGW